MGKQYRWCEAAGPVPYPNDPTRMLDGYDELVSGDGWAELAELGFVEEVKSSAKPKKAASPPTPKPMPLPLPPKKPVVEKPKPAAKKPIVEKPKPAAKKPAAAGKKTVGELVKEVAAKSKEEPATVAGQAKKAASRRKEKKKK